MKLPTPLNISGGNPKSADQMLAASMCPYPLGGGILGDALGLEGPTGGFLRRSGVSFYIFMAAVLGGMEQWRLGVRCVAMDTRKRSTLSGGVVAARLGKVDAAVQF